jgi:hypothetical protein
MLPKENLKFAVIFTTSCVLAAINKKILLTNLCVIALKRFSFHFHLHFILPRFVYAQINFLWGIIIDKLISNLCEFANNIRLD